MYLRLSNPSAGGQVYGRILTYSNHAFEGSLAGPSLHISNENHPLNNPSLLVLPLKGVVWIYPASRALTGARPLIWQCKLGSSVRGQRARGYDPTAPHILIVRVPGARDRHGCHSISDSRFWMADRPGCVARQAMSCGAEQHERRPAGTARRADARRPSVR